MKKEEENAMLGSEVTSPTAKMEATMQPSKNYRELLKKRNGDLDENNDDAIYDYLDSSFKEYDTMSEENKKAKQAAKDMSDLINSDRDAKNIFDGLLSKTDENGEKFSLIGYILNEHWDEIKDSQSSEEALAKIAKKQDDEAKAEEERAARSKTRESNYEKAEKAFADAKNEIGADNKTAGEMLDWLLSEDEDNKGLIWRAPMYDLTKDDFVKLLHAFQRDGEIEKATNAGRQEGRQQQAGRMHRRNATPTDLGTSTGAETETVEENPTAERYSRMRPRFA